MDGALPRLPMPAPARVRGQGRDPGRRPSWRMAWFALLMLCCSVAFAADALLLLVSGEVHVQRGEGAQAALRPLTRGDELRPGDIIITGDNGRVQIRFSDGSLVSLQPRSRFRIDVYRFDKDSQRGFFSLLHGSLRTITGLIGKGNPNDYLMRTPTATIGVRGTDFLVEHTICNPVCSPGARQGMQVHVSEGRVVVTNTTGSIEVPAGKGVFVGAPDQLPVADDRIPAGEALPPGNPGRPGPEVAPTSTFIPYERVTPPRPVAAPAPSSSSAAPVLRPAIAAPMRLPAAGMPQPAG